MGPKVVIIGAGFGGLSVARALRQVGVRDVVVLERGGDVGGVWRDNTYPGAACDVPSPLYSWSWAPHPGWSRRFGPQKEILEYLRSAARDHGLLDLVRTGIEVTSATWDASARCWQVRTTDGTTYDADVVVAATGQLSEPVVPSVAGRFDGPAFHSARWRHDVDLAGKRVAVAGTGASAVQLVPGIVDEVASLVVLQRSAPYVLPKADQEYRPLHSRAFRRFPSLLAAERRWWLWFTERLNAALGGGRSARPVLTAMRLASRLHLRRQVRDPGLRRRLVPDHPIGCKRVLFSNDYYPALDRTHVEVVPEPVTGLEPTGVRTADGRLHEVDVLIWCTGFAATRFLGDLQVTGVAGRDLRAEWEGGARAHLGLSVPGFPNFFCIYGPNTNLGGSSIIAMLEAQAGYVAQVARRIAEGRARALTVRREAYDAFDTEVQTRLRSTAFGACDSWYVDDGRVTTNWPGLVAEYQARLAQVDWDDLEEVGSGA